MCLAAIAAVRAGDMVHGVHALAASDVVAARSAADELAEIAARLPE